MVSELIVIAFPHRSQARTVLDALRTMRKAPILALENAVVVIREPDGEVTLYREEAVSSGRPAQDTRLLKSFATVVWGPGAGRAADAQAGCGLDTCFIRETKRALEDSRSAVLALARPGGAHDADETLRALALFKGQICRTTVSPEAEAYLLR
jgi:uncharacterized membrane protein